MAKPHGVSLLLLVFGLSCLPLAAGEETTPAEPTAPAAAAEQATPAPAEADPFEPPAGWGSRDEQGLTKLANDPYVAVDKEKKTVYLRAQFSPAARGVYTLLEFFLISGVKSEDNSGEDDPRYGYEKAYESAFITRAQPFNIHLALMMAGYRPGQFGKNAPAGLSKGTLGGEYGMNDLLNKKKAGEETQNPSLFDISVEWKEGETYKTLRAEKIMTDRARHGAPQDTPWVFTGSFMFSGDDGNKVYAADRTRAVIGSFFNESALINLPYYTLNPQSGDGGMELDANNLPASWTKEKEIIHGYTAKKVRVPKHPVFVVLAIKPATVPVPKADADPAGNATTSTTPTPDAKTGDNAPAAGDGNAAQPDAAAQNQKEDDPGQPLLQPGNGKE